MFAIVVVVFLLVFVTIILGQLEKRKVVDSSGEQEQVVHLPKDWLYTEDTASGTVYRFNDKYMLRRSFPVTKAAGTVRIVLTGESFMMGSPWVIQDGNPNITGGIPDWLQAEFAWRFPSARFEIINAAVGAQNSTRVREIVERMVQVEPDLMIVATGNNEGYVPPSRVNELLREWVVYRVLKKALIRPPRIDERSFFTPQDPETKKIEDQFQENIRSMIAACREAKVPLLICTLPVNWTYRGPDPGVHGVSGKPEADPHLQRGRELLKAGDWNGAAQELSQAAHQGYAALYLAEIQERLGQIDMARQLYRLHVQLVPNNRTRPSFNEFVRRTTKQQGVPLVDFERAADRLAGTAIVPPEFYWDYCHLTKHGYYQMMLEIEAELLRRRLLPATLGNPQPAPTHDELVARDQKLAGQ